MTQLIRRSVVLLPLAAAAWLFNGDMSMRSAAFLVASAEAWIGRPATPVSYAGVARRSTVRAVTPGVGAPGYGVRPGYGLSGVGGPASGAGVLPGAGVGQAGVGYSRGVGVNLGGPVNRVGIR